MLFFFRVCNEFYNISQFMLKYAIEWVNMGTVGAAMKYKGNIFFYFFHHFWGDCVRMGLIHPSVL